MAEPIVGQYYKYFNNSIIKITSVDAYYVKYNIITSDLNLCGIFGQGSVASRTITHLPGYSTPLWKLLNE
jgi:hypothetical protein